MKRIRNAMCRDARRLIGVFRQIRCCGRALAGGKLQQWQLQKLPLPNPPLRFAQRRGLEQQQQQQLLLQA